MHEDINSVGTSIIDDRRRNSDRRGSPRRRILKGGRTFWPNGDSSDCTVCNLSETGAQLDLHGPAPNIFDLVIEGEAQRLSCAVVWRRENRVGVRFKEPLRSAPTTKQTSRGVADFKRCAIQRQEIAGRVLPSDRELLLDMANAWKTAIRRLQRKAR